jgi:acetyltransferase-like isoleucine patch superfamily enzyme
MAGARLGPGCVLAEDAVVEANASLGPYTVVEAAARVGTWARLGARTLVCPGTQIGAGAVIETGAVLGRRPLAAVTSTVRAAAERAPLTLGPDCVVGAGTVVYAGTTLGESVYLGDGALVREDCRVGAQTLIGSGCIVENNVNMGRAVKIQSGAYITAHMTIEDEVFIAPMVVTTNDNYMGRGEKRSARIRGATIRRRARVGGGAVLLPGIELGEESFIAAGAVLTKDAAAAKVLVGCPARVRRDVPEEELL